MSAPGADLGPLFAVLTVVPADTGPAAFDPGSILALVIAAVVGLALLTYVPGAIVRIWSEHRLRSLAQGKLVLTYDDGPSPVSTRPILELLDEFGARATFYVIGRRADEHPEICDLVRTRGHEIGSHSRAHCHAWRRPLRSIFDVVAGCRAVARWTSAAPSFRPPCGRVTLWSWLAVRLCGHRIVVWTLDTKDAVEQPLPLDHVETLLRRDGGGVVLMHDLDWPDDPARVEHVLALTRRILEVGRELGLKACTMSELLHNGRQAG